MEKLKRIEISLYREILITLLLVVISIPVWFILSQTQAKELSSSFKGYKFTTYQLLNKADYNLIAMNDEVALKNLETQDLIVHNNSMIPENYTLYLKIDKSKDYSNLKISVNYNVNYLKNLEFVEDINYKYYKIDSSSLVANSQKYIITLWNSDESLVYHDENIFYDFYLDSENVA